MNAWAFLFNINIYMRLAEHGQATYFPVSGTPMEGMLLADMHAHVKGDTSGKPKSILRAAKRSGITTLTISDHDSTSSNEESVEINERDRLGLKLVRSVESTAVVERKKGKRGKPRHVLVYGIQETPPCYMPVEELNAWAHDQGGYTSAAHPGLGRFSMTEEEILEVQDESDEAHHFDFAEARNGGVLTLNAFALKHRLTTSALVRTGLMPTANELHERTERFLEKMKEKLGLKGVTAGSDGHDATHVGEVVVGYDPSKSLFDSLAHGEVVIMQRGRLAPETPRPFIEKTFKSWKLEWDRRRGNNGIVLYVPKSENNNRPERDVA